jgi:hypothetical protein
VSSWSNKTTKCLGGPSLRQTFFIEVDELIQDAVTAILADYPNLVDPNKGRGGADPFIVALAHLNGSTVVSEETSKPNKPRIPDACAGLGVPCINLLRLMLEQEWSYR